MNCPSSAGWRATAASILILVLLTSSSSAKESFDPVGRLFIRRCLECHNELQAAGGLVLESRESMLRGGESGEVVEPGKAEESLLLERVLSGEMPPEEKGKSQKLAAAEIDLLRRWISSGAEWPAKRRLNMYELTTDKRGGRDWWSLQPLKRPQIPNVRGGERVNNPIDAFVLARLEPSGMTPAPAADRRTLIRRLYFDLIGLPPTFEEIEAFVADDRPDAYERVVDQLLASPHYGERWGRFWLDLVRYAETCGYERDQIKPAVWKYRDWVIQALNDDKPYDQFVLEQLAGDELSDRDEQSVIATGFLRLGTWNDEPNDPQEYKYERLEDMVHATSTAFLGLTVKCARCHDHKFDPIPQVDYYRMATAFWAGFIEPGDRALLGGPNKDRLGFDVFGWTDRAREPPPLKLLLKGNPKRPGPVVAFEHLTMFTSLKAKVLAPPPDSNTSHRRLQLAKWIARADNPLTARVLVNRLWQHHFGQPLVGSPNNFGYKGDLPTHPKLLDWLASEFTHPTMSVHVTSPSVDAKRFSAEDKSPSADNKNLSGKAWTIKRMQKLIVMTSAYRQSADHAQHDVYAGRDSANRHLWRGNRRRLDAEAMRDRMLAVSGEIDLRLGGPSFRPTIHPEALEGLSRKSSAWQASPEAEQHRRSVYIFTKRGLLPPLMTTFDFNDTTLPCGKRNVTTVSPQALALLNNQFVHHRSQALARRVQNAAGNQPAQIKAAWRYAFGRDPSAAEVAAAAQHLSEQRASFAPQSKQREQVRSNKLTIRDGLALHLRADIGVTEENGRVSIWRDQSGKSHHARQPKREHRPVVALRAISGRASMQFDGKARFLAIDGQVLTSQPCAVFAVVTDQGGGAHREIFSNWNGAAGNSTTSIFLGTTGDASVRFSDHFLPSKTIANKQEPFVLTANARRDAAAVFQNATPLAIRNSALPTRNLKTQYVVGQQGNIHGEYWKGDIAELIVFDRALADSEVRNVWSYLSHRYGLGGFEQPARKSAALLALESLCHVLLNSNEFLYVD